MKCFVAVVYHRGMGYGKMFERMFVAAVFRMVIGALLGPIRRRFRG